MKKEYGLWVIQGERDAMVRELTPCPVQPLPARETAPLMPELAPAPAPGAGTRAGPAPGAAPAPAPTPAPAPPQAPAPAPAGGTDPNYGTCREA